MLGGSLIDLASSLHRQNQCRSAPEVDQQSGSTILIDVDQQTRQIHHHVDLLKAECFEQLHVSLVTTSEG